MHQKGHVLSSSSLSLRVHPSESNDQSKGNISSSIITVIVIIIILAAAAGFWFWQRGNINKQDLGSQLFKETQNPIKDKIPEANPFSKVNPFKGVYKNPFE